MLFICILYIFCEFVQFGSCKHRHFIIFRVMYTTTFHQAGIQCNLMIFWRDFIMCLFKNQQHFIYFLYIFSKMIRCTSLSFQFLIIFFTYPSTLWIPSYTHNLRDTLNIYIHKYENLITYNIIYVQYTTYIQKYLHKINVNLKF